MDFIRGQNSPYFSWDFDFKIWFRARYVTLPGLSETGPWTLWPHNLPHILIGSYQWSIGEQTHADMEFILTRPFVIHINLNFEINVCHFDHP